MRAASAWNCSAAPTTASSSPTRAAQFLIHARSVLSELKAAAEELREPDGPLRATLRISASMTLGTMHLGPLVTSFLKAEPELKVAIDLDDRYMDVAEGGFDLAIRIGDMADSALIGRRLATSRRVLCASPEYLDRHGAPSTVDDLAEHAVIAHAHMSSSLLWRFEGDDSAPSVGGHARTRLTANNGEVMRQAAVESVDLLVAPSFMVAAELARGSLRAIRLDRRPTSQILHAVYPRLRFPSRAVRALIDHLAAAIGDPPYWDRGIESHLA